jgi:hypothetical protein
MTFFLNPHSRKLNELRYLVKRGIGRRSFRIQHLQRKDNHHVVELHDQGTCCGSLAPYLSRDSRGSRPYLADL